MGRYPVIQNEPNVELRTISATLYDALGVLVPAGTVWAAGMSKVSKAGGAFVNTAALPLAVPGGGDGAFDLELTIAECDTVGTLRVRFFDAAAVFLGEYTDTVYAYGSPPVVAFGAITWLDVMQLPGAAGDGLGSVPVGGQTLILACVSSTLHCDPGAFDGESGPITKLARCALAAHMATMGKLGAGGALRAESDGKLSRAYQVDTSRGGLSMTSYGQLYLSLITPANHGPRLL